ncbi:MAG: hypothetical protein NDI63_14925 [Pseudobdellovibrio sp.]|nr:hypothetical protein [Pseudobdellovibrio sp.]
MSSQNLGEVSKNLYDLLTALEPEDRQKVLTSVLALLGEEIKKPIVVANGKNSVLANGSDNLENDPSEVGSAKDFFSLKNPENRGEAFAVAARYLEFTKNQELVNKDDLLAVFKEARRNFDSKNFSRDITNAIHNAKLFLSGDERETYKLSFYGQEYVDALPKREDLKSIKRPGKNKKKISKKDSDPSKQVKAKDAK